MFDVTDLVEDGKIKTLIDGYGPAGSLLSIYPCDDNKTVCLTVGAKWEYSCAGWLGKQSLTELANALLAVAECMEEYEPFEPNVTEVIPRQVTRTEYVAKK